LTLVVTLLPCALPAFAQNNPPRETLLMDFGWRIAFNYCGEETPVAWPDISSQFCILDTCKFPKNNAYYLMPCHC